MVYTEHQQAPPAHPSVLAFSMDEAGRLLSCESGWQEFTGVADPRWLEEHWTLRIHPQDRARLDDAMRASHGRAQVTGHFRLQRADGQYRHMHLRASAHPARDGGRVLSGVLTDMSAVGRGHGGSGRHNELTEAVLRTLGLEARRRAAQDAEDRVRARRSVDALLAASPDAMALVDPEGRYVHVNDQMARLTGVSRLALIGRSVREFYPGVWEAIAPFFNAAASGDVRQTLDSDEFEVSLAESDGTVTDLLVRVYPVTGREGRLLGLGLSLTDITVMKRAERALLEANALKDEFLSIASHELRNPVAAVRGSAQLLMRSLRRKTLDEQRLETYLAAILEASEHLSELTGDLLDVSRLQRGQFPMRPRPASLRALTEAVVTGHRGRGRLVVEASQDPCVAWVDPARFEQILENLLENAEKYAPGGTPIEIGLRPDGEGVLLTVRDRGMGLPAGAAEEIFKPFGRASNAVAANVPGLGLGLYICRRIAEQTGGRLWAESDGEGKGTTMLAWFPRGAGEASSPGSEQ